MFKFGDNIDNWTGRVSVNNITNDNFIFINLRFRFIKSFRRWRRRRVILRNFKIVIRISTIIITWFFVETSEIFTYIRFGRSLIGLGI